MTAYTTTMTPEFYATALRALTPVEIDTAIAAFYQTRYREQIAADRAWQYMVDSIRSAQGLRYNDKVSPTQIREWLAEHEEVSESPEMIREAYGDRPYLATYAERAWKHYLDYQDHAAQADEALAATEPLEAEWERRGRWTRAYLVDNTNGHVHSSMNCSTCFTSTQYHWLVDLADHSETEIVEQAGERACTVCYPSAPAEVLNRPTRTFTPTEIEKQKAREEREAKRAAKAAAAVEVDGYYGWHSNPVHHVFKTERAAVLAYNAVVENLVQMGATHPYADKWTNDIVAIAFALGAKGHDTAALYDTAKDKAAKKAKREGWTPKL